MERQPSETRQKERRDEVESEDSRMMRLRISMGMILEREKDRSLIS